MCAMGEDETVEHVVVECGRFERDRRGKWWKWLTELGYNSDERVEKIEGRDGFNCWEYVGVEAEQEMGTKFKERLAHGLYVRGAP